MSTVTGSSQMSALTYFVFPAVLYLVTLLYTFFQRKINKNISERTSTVLFSCLHNPPSFQALLSRGITELLLTSDNKEGLKLGGVKGGIVRQTSTQTNTHTHTHTNTHTVWWFGVLCFHTTTKGRRAAQCQAEAVQNLILHTKNSVLYQKVVVLSVLWHRHCDAGK